MTAPAAPELSLAQTAARLKEMFPALFTALPVLPLKLRIQADIQQRAPGVFTKKALSIFLHRYTTGTPYLVALAEAPQRADLDGAPAGDIAAEHREAAVAELARRREAHAARRAAERAAMKSQHAPRAEAGRGQPRPHPAPAGPGDAAPATGPGMLQSAQDPQGLVDSQGPDRPHQPQRPPTPPRPPRPSGSPRPPGGPGTPWADRPPRPDRAAAGERHPGTARPGSPPPGRRPHGGRPDQPPQSAPDRGGSQGPQGQQRPQHARPSMPPHAQQQPLRPPRHEAAAPERTPHDPAQRERALLLRAYETTTLNRANFCALKRIGEAELEAALTLARQERSQR